MAGKRVSRSLYNLLYQHETRNIHLSSKASKKTYNYDLDSLIKWKKETHKAFGSPRKPTKTGKLKKLKKELESEIQMQLAFLNAIHSNKEDHSDIIAETISNNCTRSDLTDFANIPTDVLASQVPPPDAVPLYGTAMKTSIGFGYKSVPSSKKNVNFDIPDSVLDSLSELHNTVNSCKSSCSFSHDTDEEYEKAAVHEESTNDEIFIPKITPVPTDGLRLRLSSASHHSTLTRSSDHIIKSSLSDENPEKSYEEFSTAVNLETTGTREHSVGVMSGYINASHVAKELQESNITAKNRSNEGTQERNLSSTAVCSNQMRTNIKRKKYSNELHIPKIAQIPSDKSSLANKSSSQIIGFPASPKPFSAVEKFNLPIEAPESFEIISKFPLFPKESTEWQKNFDQDKLTAFKIDVESLGMRFLPSVKSIINKTMSDLNKYFLNRWRDTMTSELGEEGFKQHQEATIRAGVNLHANIMEYLSGKPLSEIQIMPENKGHWSSLQAALATVSDVRALEVEIFHNALLYRGVFDCVARYKDMLCIIDWKTSKKPRPLLKNTYDNPVQIVAYLGALNANETYVAKYGQLNHGMLVMAYHDGSPAHIHMMDRAVCEQYWHGWRDRLYNFYQLAYTEKLGAEKLSNSNFGATSVM